MQSPDQHQAPTTAQWIYRCVFLGFAAIAAFYLITEHSAHLLGWLPFLLLAACPLMHVFGGHGHHGGHGGHEDEAPRDGGAAPDSNTNDASTSSSSGHHHH